MNLKREKPEVGQVVYRLNVGDESRWREQSLTKLEVRKVGRKYFYLGIGNPEQKFHVDTWEQVSGYSATSRIYATEQEWADELEANNLQDLMLATFDHSSVRSGRISIECFRELAAVLEKHGVVSQ